MSADNQSVRLVIAIIAVVMPQWVKRAIYSRVFGWDVDRSARIGLSLVMARSARIGARVSIGNFNAIRVGGLIDMEPNAMIGSFNVINGCDSVQLGRYACVGYGNWISGPPLSGGLFPSSPDRQPVFRLGEHASVVRNHRIECSDAVTIGRYTIIGGTRTEILTHGIDIWQSVQRTGAVEIGEYCYLGSSVVVQSGANIPARSVVAPGAVVHASPGSPEQLLGGVPARFIKSLAGAKFFERSRGQVD